jgi:hypothetical protein
VDSVSGRAVVAQLLRHADALTSLRDTLDAVTVQQAQAEADTADTLADLLTRLHHLEGHLGTDPTGSGSSQHPDGTAGPEIGAGWCWRHLGPRATATLTAELGGWVDWLRGRYPLARRVPPCWASHPELVEELTALWVAWQAAYTHPDAHPTAPADWHDRWLPGLLHRLAHGPHATDCDPDHHRPRPPSGFRQVTWPH